MTVRATHASSAAALALASSAGPSRARGRPAARSHPIHSSSSFRAAWLRVEHLVAELVAVGGVERGERGRLAPVEGQDVIVGLGLIGRDGDRRRAGARRMRLGTRRPAYGTSGIGLSSGVPGSNRLAQQAGHAGA